MWSGFKQFDAYTLKARVFPALIAGLPTMALLFVLVPWDKIGLPHLIASVMGFILLFAFADVARRYGKKVEERMGTRATPELWHYQNNQIDEVSKERYRRFLATKINSAAPSAQMELDDPARANSFYLSAGNWLRDQTRDTKKFKILFDELLTYGFRRNLLGLKPISLILNALVLCVCIGIFLFRIPYFEAIPDLGHKVFVIVVAVVFHSAYMIFAVGKDAVREASYSYGKQLILSCETLMPKPRATASTPRKPKEPKA